jgi:SAM-dependent methyltransferase
MVPYDFNPNFRHPLYFIRKGLYNKIKLYSAELNGRLLDFGCGAKPYRSLFTGVDAYLGVDFAGEGHDHTNENIDVYYDGKTLPFPDASFDSIFSSEVFEHIFNLPEILPELNRVLKPGGRMLLTCPFAWEEHEVPADYARYTRFALQDLLAQHGFQVITLDKNGHFMRALHQLFIVYLNDQWLHRVWFFSRFNLFKKIVRQLLVPLLNGLFLLVEPIWPQSNTFYLNTILLVEKK